MLDMTFPLTHKNFVSSHTDDFNAFSYAILFALHKQVLAKIIAVAAQTSTL